MPLTDEQRDWLRLALVPGIGTTHFVRLLARYRTPRRVFEASARELEEVVGRNLAVRLAEYAETQDLRGQEKAMEAFGASLITLNDTAYPMRLGEIFDPPLVLFQRGSLIDADENAIAIVGTRRATPYGIRMAERLARDLASRGMTIVSGMAEGIDTAAHRGALAAGGRTIAVLGCGVDVVYPESNRTLMEEIAANGAVLSQFSMGMKPMKGNFPIRNRIISGMSLGTVVVQAPARSGALITAHTAVEQGREVFAVPGEVGAPNAEGPHQLIREGAKLIENAEDILLELNIEVSAGYVEPPIEQHTAPPKPAAVEAPATRSQPIANVSDNERRVLSALKPDGSFIDDIAQTCRVSISEALSALTMLEIKGMVRQFSGKRFAPR